MFVYSLGVNIYQDGHGKRRGGHTVGGIQRDVGDLDEKLVRLLLWNGDGRYNWTAEEACREGLHVTFHTAISLLSRGEVLRVFITR